MKLLPISLLFLFACMSQPIEDLGPPPLGQRVYDRVGRAAVSTALIGVAAPKGDRSALQERYNETDFGGWSEFRAELAENLAIYDALDGACGNQILAGASASPGRYDALADVLADDRLVVNTASGECNQYLAIELGMTNDCGGRTPFHDVIDVTYSLLAIGAPSGVTDGIDADAKPPSTEFPYFAR